MCVPLGFRVMIRVTLSHSNEAIRCRSKRTPTMSRVQADNDILIGRKVHRITNMFHSWPHPATRCSSRFRRLARELQSRAHCVSREGRTGNCALICNSSEPSIEIIIELAAIFTQMVRL